MSKSSIEWTENTWNPVTGCTKLSTGCLHCYAERMAKRLKAMGQPNYQDGFSVRCHERMLSVPLKWKKPRTVFVNSMSDLFHAEVPEDFIGKVFSVMNQATRHRFQVLTNHLIIKFFKHNLVLLITRCVYISQIIGYRVHLPLLPF